jgi:hypothetical protein
MDQFLLLIVRKSGGDMYQQATDGAYYLAIKPQFGWAPPWLVDIRTDGRPGARCGGAGARAAIYQLIQLYGAGHHLCTVTCYYWWTNHM